jgi:hypothetical protein
MFDHVQIHQLRQDLDWAKKQVAFLTTNLNTNVSAFSRS